ncbi:unnamed protein product [Ilex paraguariensis]|uniref:Protein WVD2-like 7 n=1 Tax=Ilex paraguariensis TaxID=185542 RepID=A0ABC8SXB3_9AQUA
MSESLAWEKWSTFSHKRYVEEAERYAQPGSVAQKKAFFEAHYKRIATKKAAAVLLDQLIVATDTSEPELEGRVCDDDTSTHDSPSMVLGSQVAADEQHESKTQDTEVEFIQNADECNSIVQPESTKMEGADLVTEKGTLVENPTTHNQVEDDEYQIMVSGELSGTPLVKKPLLGNSSSSQDVSLPMIKKKPFLSSLKPSVFCRPSKIPTAPGKSIAPMQAWKENVAPTPKKFTIASTDQYRSTPKSLHTVISSSPSREHVKSTNPAGQKTECFRVALSAIKATTKDYATPLRTTKMGFVNGVPKHPSANPCSENRRVKETVDLTASGNKNLTASGNKTAGPKWHTLSAVYSKSVTACQKKLQSPPLSTPFILRTKERAARRKQARLWSVVFSSILYT